ncbi:MAG: zinc ABC transporter substrate-binding protein [Actinomycetota bacterium]|jgi:zinc/manganese transport system substrate-binding protein|nr:zinc ABC transporter substrate-binding protein [Actinomycetota bacterium]
MRERLAGRRAFRIAGTVAAMVGVAAVLSACSTSPSSPSPSASGGQGTGAIPAVGAENTYAGVISQIGGPYVEVTAVESNPNTDPHTFEASPKVAEEIASAKLVVQNGLGYDSWATRIEAASPQPDRKVIDVQQLLNLPDSTPNPHLWYKPSTMPAVADAVAKDLAALAPAHASVFESRAKAFVSSLKPWDQAIAAFDRAHPGTPVAVTEPVADYMLEAAGCRILTPFSLQAAIMNGTDPSPQDVTDEENLFNDHRVKVFLYNQQVTDSLTASFLALARHDGIPVVGVYETMPTPGYDYQSWMIAEVHALDAAVTHHTSTSRL